MGQEVKFSGDALAKARAARKWSQSELAYELTVRMEKLVPAATVSKWETQRQVPHGNYIGALAAVLGCSADDFYPGLDRKNLSRPLKRVALGAAAAAAGKGKVA